MRRGLFCLDASVSLHSIFVLFDKDFTKRIRNVVSAVANTNLIKRIMKHKAGN